MRDLIEASKREVSQAIVRYGERAIQVALQGPGVGGRNRRTHRLGAILVKDRTIVATSFNSYKTHTRLSDIYAFPYIHAEAGCILRAGFSTCKDSFLFVARVRQDGSIGLARPCEECVRFINLAKLSEVYYTEDGGSLTSLFGKTRGGGP